MASLDAWESLPAATRGKPGDGDERRRFQSAVQRGLQALRGFNFGAKGQRVRSVRDAAARLAKRSDVKYLEPKSPPISPLGIAKSVRIYVLGPPRDAAMLGLTERQSEMYGLGVAGGWPIARALGNAFAINKKALLAGDDDHGPVRHA
jgi:hypothetical protein